MISHRTYSDSLILNDNTKSIWLQVSKWPNDRSCCTGFGPYNHRFEHIIQEYNDWFMYLLPTVPGKVHRFETVAMIHKSRDDVRIPDGIKIYSNGSRPSGRYFYDPVHFIESHCDLDIGKQTDHIHIHLFYPSALVNESIVQPTPAESTMSQHESIHDLMEALLNFTI